jgi:hypothetical protein
VTGDVREGAEADEGCASCHTPISGWLIKAMQEGRPTDYATGGAVLKLRLVLLDRLF